MPVYVYRFEDGTEVEMAQGIKEDAYQVLQHPVTRKPAPVKRVYGHIGVSFKGGGFYKTSKRSKETGGE